MWEKEKWKVCVIETHTSTLFTSIFALYFWFKVCSNNTLLISMCVGGKNRKAQYLMRVYLIQLCCILCRLFFCCLCMHFDQVLVALKCSWFWLNCTWSHRKFPSSCFYSAFATDLPPMGTLTQCSSVMLSWKKITFFFVVISFYSSVLYCMKLPFLNSVLPLCPLITVLTQWLEWSWIWKLGWTSLRSLPAMCQTIDRVLTRSKTAPWIMTNHFRLHLQ